jgi:hypothetical protein
VNELPEVQLDKLRKIRAKLVRGEITETEAREKGFPPADPTKEKR